MKIALKDIGKKFNHQWIFKNISHEFSPENPTVIIGSNGSGKSTLCQIIAGYYTPSTGKVTYSENEILINAENIFKYISVCSPHIELIEEFTLPEMIAFYRGFKTFINSYTDKEIIKMTGLEVSSEKLIQNFSSGMKQRVKLALALCSDVQVIILDEPCTNLDNQGIEWYNSLIGQQLGKALIIVASNTKEYEYRFCKATLNVEQFQQA